MYIYIFQSCLSSSNDTYVACLLERPSVLVEHAVVDLAQQNALGSELLLVAAPTCCFFGVANRTKLVESRSKNMVRMQSGQYRLLTLMAVRIPSTPST